MKMNGSYVSVEFVKRACEEYLAARERRFDKKRDQFVADKMKPTKFLFWKFPGLSKEEALKKWERPNGGNIFSPKDHAVLYALSQAGEIASLLSMARRLDPKKEMFVTAEMFAVLVRYHEYDEVSDRG
jgi:hypothetical protein